MIHLTAKRRRIPDEAVKEEERDEDRDFRQKINRYEERLITERPGRPENDRADRFKKGRGENADPDAPGLAIK